MATGIVKWFNDAKGFGFITSGEGGKDVFVHHTVIEGEGFHTLEEGETVDYDSEDGPKGMKATKVRRFNPPLINALNPLNTLIPAADTAVAVGAAESSAAAR